MQPCPEGLEKDGKPRFVVLACDEYQALQTVLEDVEDLLDPLAAREQDGATLTVSLAEAKLSLGLENELRAPSDRAQVG